MGVRRLSDALRLLTSVEVVEADGVASTLSIRSMLPDGIGQLVQVLVDGVPMHNASRIYPLDLDLLPIPVDLIQAIEVVRGPSSSLYGTNAVSGVVSITTRRAAAPVEGMIRGALATRSVRRGEASLLIRRGGFQVVAGGEAAVIGDSGQRPFRLLGGEAVPDFDPEDDGHRQGRVQARIRWEGASVAAWGGLGRAEKRLREDLATAFAIEAPSQRIRMDVAHVGGSWRSPLGTLHAQASGTRESLRAGRVPSMAGLDPGFLKPEHEYARFDSLTLDLKDTLSLEGGGVLVVGADRHTVQNPDMPSYGLAAGEVERTGIYANLTQPLGSRWTLGAGLRWEQGELGGAHWAPRITLLWSPGQETTLRFGLLSASRSPTLAEAQAEIPALLIRRNEALDYERIESLEVGVRHGSGAWFLDAGAYAMRYRHGITYVLTAAGDREYQNLSKGWNHGLEGSLHWRSGTGLVSGLNLNWTRFALDHLGHPTTYAPRLKGTAWLRGRRGPLSGSLTVQRISATPVNGFLITAPGGLSLEERPGYTQVHAFGSLELSPGVTLEAYLRNGARERTFQGVGGATTTVLYRWSRREAGLGLTWRW